MAEKKEPKGNIKNGTIELVLLLLLRSEKKYGCLLLVYRFFYVLSIDALTFNTLQSKLIIDRLIT